MGLDRYCPFVAEAIGAVVAGEIVDGRDGRTGFVALGLLGYAGASSTGVWRSLVARFVRDEEAVGSNPATPTENCWSEAQCH